MSDPEPRATDGPTGDDIEVPVARRGRVAAVIAGVLLVLIGLFAWVLATAEPATDRLVSTPLRGKVAPALVGETIDGRSYDLDSQRGRWVLVNFFAEWCTPCRREHPELVAFAEAHDVLDDAVVVGVIYDDDVEGVRDFFAENGGNWPVVIDPQGRIALDYGVTGVPESFLVSPEGVVIERIAGGVTREGLDRLLRALGEARGA